MNQRFSLLLCGLLLAGCSRQDTDRLARIGKTVRHHAEQSLAQLRDSLRHSVADLSDPILAERVRQRLAWDRQLEGAVIEVEAKAGLVVLKGQVRHHGQRERAAELANATVGVEKVKDALTVKE